MKMSKSLGNTIVPEEVVKQYGADILRLWVAQTDYTPDQRIGPEILKGVADSYRRLRNTMRYMLGALSHFKEDERVSRAICPSLSAGCCTGWSELDLKPCVEGYASLRLPGRVSGGVYLCLTMDLSLRTTSTSARTCLYCDGDTADAGARRARCWTMLYQRLTNVAGTGSGVHHGRESGWSGSRATTARSTWRTIPETPRRLA